MLQRFFHGVKCPGYRTLTNVEFPPTWDLIHVKCPGVAQDGGGGGGGWAFLDLTHTLERAKIYNNGRFINFQGL